MSVLPTSAVDKDIILDSLNKTQYLRQSHKIPNITTCKLCDQLERETLQSSRSWRVFCLPSQLICRWAKIHSECAAESALERMSLSQWRKTVLWILDTTLTTGLEALTVTWGDLRNIPGILHRLRSISGELHSLRNIADTPHRLRNSDKNVVTELLGPRNQSYDPSHSSSTTERLALQIKGPA